MAVMYLGRLVELGPTDEVFASPAHPYTAALLASVPKLVLDADELVSFEPIEGEIPSPLDPPPGCHFAPRCALATNRCRAEAPRFRPILEGCFSACHFAEKQHALARGAADGGG